MVRAAFPIFFLSLAACTGPLSFAPPEVGFSYKDQASQGCDSKTPRQQQVERDVPGAFKVVDMFVDAYRCRANSTADGKQIFDVPAFVATTGGAAAAALGTGVTVGILAQTGNAVFNAGKAYYDPDKQGNIINAAVGALICVRTEAAGADHFNLKKASDEEEDNETGRVRTRDGGGNKPSGSIYLPVDEQFFQMVTSATLSVDHVARERLKSVGTLDAAGVAKSIIDNAVKAREAAEKKKKAEEEGPKPGQRGFGTLNVDEQEERRKELVKVDLELLEAELQSCIDLAKL